MLYKLKGQEEYGIKLATDSEGRIVLDMKATGNLVAFDPNVLEEVLPYSVDVSFRGLSGKTYSFQADPNSLAVGDLVIDPRYDDPLRIVAIDTKSRKATKKIQGYVYKGTKL